MSDPQDENETEKETETDWADLPHPIFNWLSITGIALLSCSLAGVVFFLLIGLAHTDESSYAFLTIVPPILLGVFGALMIIAGFVRERWRHKRRRHSSFLERIVVDPLDFVRGTGSIVIVSTLALGTMALLGAGAGSLAAIEYTESNDFCGNVCHAVMNPEASVYQQSPHARIKCVECHVGSTTEGYIRAKIGGLRQLWAVTTGEISRPIPTPIRGRRPSREMCESCHTSDRMIGYKALERTYFPSGKETDPVTLRMIVKVGGGGADGLIPGEGIHYHMLAERKVEYIARDPQSQDIALIRVTSADGEVKEFSNQDKPLTDDERKSLEMHKIECVDCHSRPAHRFTNPATSVNAAIAAGKIPSTLPRIKEASVRALDGGYSTTEQALAEIGPRLKSFYEEQDPELLDGKPEQLEPIASVLQEIYQRTIFPEMKADWRAHPDNIGHRDSPGCFRCHNDVMVDAEGTPIFTDCSRCHAIIAQGNKVIQTTAEFEKGRSFIHPKNSKSFNDEFTLCTDCHTGGAEVYDE